MVLVYSEEIISYVRKNGRFYAADIYSWLRVALDFAMGNFDYEWLGCVRDNRTSVSIDDRSVTVQSRISSSQRIQHIRYWFTIYNGGMYYDVQKDPYLIQCIAILLSVFSEELIVSITYCRRKQTVVASRGKVLPYTIEDTAEPDEVYMKATFDSAIYGDTSFDPLSVTRLLNCFYNDIKFENVHVAIHR